LVRAFIDSNVIANWILVNARYREINKIEDETESEKELKRFEEKLKKYPYQKNSYDFLQHLSKNKHNYVFFVSQLVLNEVFSVILEEYVAKKLIAEGIPIRFWSKDWKQYKEKTQLPNEYSVDIVNGINNFIDTFLDEPIIYAKEKYDRKSIVEFIIGFKCDTHDASICAIAIANKCKYLITEDSRLRDQLKKCEIIKLMSSEEFRLKFFK